MDSWAWLALADKREKPYREASDLYLSLRNGGGKFFTTDYVLDETITRIFKKVTFSQASKYIQAIFKMVELDFLSLENINEDRFKKAWKLRQKYGDKPSISFTDLTSFVVMQELNIKKVFTGDEHFEHVNLGFKKVP
ncbi:MAG: PIN domain protein [Candidatus Scalindua rubra]|uniref:PIN domain protein n=1 Tax=Candidatus Scalindua rubra TaxID=1872076 RepID=A0A1E3XEU6_9BACT|nr:MAG: PIN domain protein [Candidatus Scalindua rubra]